MNLVDLDPRFVGAGGEGVSNADGSPIPERHGVGLSFDCPCGCGDRVYVDFSNPVDGGLPVQKSGKHTWVRDGEDFATMKLSPSILRMDGCGWHGFIGKDNPGEVTTV